MCVDADLFARGLAFKNKHAALGWGLTDCTSFVVMRAQGITRALAYDHHFVHAGFRALLRE